MCHCSRESRNVIAPQVRCLGPDRNCLPAFGPCCPQDGYNYRIGLNDANSIPTYRIRQVPTRLCVFVYCFLCTFFPYSDHIARERRLGLYCIVQLYHAANKSQTLRDEAQWCPSPLFTSKGVPSLSHTLGSRACYPMLPGVTLWQQLCGSNRVPGCPSILPSRPRGGATLLFLAQLLFCFVFRFHGQRGPLCQRQELDLQLRAVLQVHGHPLTEQSQKGHMPGLGGGCLGTRRQYARLRTVQAQAADGMNEPTHKLPFLCSPLLCSSPLSLPPAPSGACPSYYTVSVSTETCVRVAFACAYVFRQVAN